MLIDFDSNSGSSLGSTVETSSCEEIDAYHKVSADKCEGIECGSSSDESYEEPPKKKRRKRNIQQAKAGKEYDTQSTSTQQATGSDKSSDAGSGTQHSETLQDNMCVYCIV